MITLSVSDDIRVQMDYLGEEFNLLNFEEITYKDTRNRKYSKYILSEDAFTLVVMSYNTRDAVQMKLK